ncbi:MAG: putative branched-chain amino acid transport system permease, binding component [Myxococcaceae bacterium]|nr:putative branched-chain amino acid transport system permease, binding component [Myxococcaceae bacterium]
MSTPPVTPASQPLLALLQVEVKYEDIILALRGVSLEVPRGAIVALLGPNGAGKTTTLKAAAGLLPAERGAVTRGSVRFDGHDTTQATPRSLVRAGVVQVLEGRRCFAQLTVEENLLSGGLCHGLSRGALRSELERIYAYFPRLVDKRRVQAGYTSGGEQQMLALGRALITRPKLLLLDEPSMGLAPKVVETIFELVATLNREEGTSFLLAEQNATLALRYAQHGYLLENGRVVASGSATELSARADVRAFYLGMAVESDDPTGRRRRSFARRETSVTPSPCL